MKSLTFGTLALLACATASLTTGCLLGLGCDGANNSYRTPVTFNPSTIQAFRTPSTCGVNDPAYTSTDTFSLELTGETSTPIPSTITVDFTPAAVTEPVPLNVTATASGASGASNDGSVHFSYSIGSDAAELDANPLDAVVVTVVSLPGADGEPLSAELHLTFQDGRELDQVYTASVKSVFVPCVPVRSSSTWVR